MNGREIATHVRHCCKIHGCKYMSTNCPVVFGNMESNANCEYCAKEEGEQKYRNPVPTVDIIINVNDEGIVLIERINPPHGWALPGGFVDYGESLEDAAVREAEEETGLIITDLKQFRAYSDPKRDPRQHNITNVFTANAKGVPNGGSDARRAITCPLDNPPTELAFDHMEILRDYVKSL